MTRIRPTSPDFFKPSSISPATLNQIYSQTQDFPDIGIISNDGNQIGPFVRCKDYIMDVVWAHNVKKPFTLYGFNYSNPETLPMPTYRLNLCVTWKNKTKEDMEQYLNNTLKTIVDIEDKSKVPARAHTYFSNVMMFKNQFNDNKEQPYFIVYGSYFWRRNVESITFFVTSMRLGLLNKEGTWESLLKISQKDLGPNQSFNDISYLGYGKPYMELLKKKGVLALPKQDWSKFSTAGSVHGQGFTRWKPPEPPKPPPAPKPVIKPTTTTGKIIFIG